MKSNPLATRFVAPGRIPWRGQAGASLAELLIRFTDQLGSRAAIVGPHGSGKSTLLEHLVPLLGTIQLRSAAYELGGDRALHDASNPGTDRIDYTAHPDRAAPADSTAQANGEAASKCVVWLSLRGAAASRRLLFRTYREWARSQCVLVLDGYEQLSVVARGAALLLTRLSGAGILVTSHKPVGLPTLLESRVDVPLAQGLIDQLLPEDLPGRSRFLDSERLGGLLEKHRGNLREVFMELYDAL